jgi:hypothetical protein
MLPCETCHKQLFPYLFDLFDVDERRAIEDHLRDCPRCQAELERARAQRADVAAAVKGSFPDVVFKPPRVTTRPAVPAAAAPRRPRRPLFLNRWAMAAAAMIALLSGGGVVAWSVLHYQQEEVDRALERVAKAQQVHQDVLREVNAKKEATQQQIRDIQKEIDRVVEDWEAKHQAEQKVLKAKGVHFEIKGPRSVQAGAPNTFDIQVKPTDPGAPPLPAAQVRAEVREEKTKKVLFTKQLAALGGPAQLVLPQNLAVKPGDDLTLVLVADVGGDAPARVEDKLTLDFPEYVTHLATDRPMYRPGETVRFRSLTLERFSLRPAAEELHLRFRITGPGGHELYKHDTLSRVVAGKDKAPVTGPDGQPLHGLGLGEFVLPQGLPGGVYTLSVGELQDRFPEEKRTFLVHHWQAPAFNKEAEFHRNSYGPGDRVVLRGKASLLADKAGGAGGAPMAPQPFGPGGMVGGGGMAGDGVNVQANVVIDGQQTASFNQTTDPDGNFAFEFGLPAKLANGDGTVVLTLSSGGQIETLVRPIPIVMRDVAVDFYPEGGDLVLGVPCRVYFQARTGTSKPADVRGRVVEVAVDKAGKDVPGKAAREVARAETLTDDQEPGINRGLGTFTFTPRPDCRYELRLDVPVGIAKGYKLPAAKATGVVLHLPQGVVTKDIPVTVLSAGKDRDLLVGAYCRGKLLDHTPVFARAGEKTDLELHPAADVGGVYRVTVFEKQGDGAEAKYAPVAERLLYRKQVAGVHVAVRPDKDSYAPGDRAVLALEARDERKEMVPAVALVAVIDASVVKLVGDKTARTMPTHFLLTTEVRQPQDLENTDVLLGNHPKAAQALDLLLGAQGWRRFAEQDPQKLRKQGKVPAFLASAQPVSRAAEGEKQGRADIDPQFVARFVELESELARKERDEAGSPELQSRVLMAQSSTNAAQQGVSDQLTRLRGMQDFFLYGALSAVGAGFLFFAFFLVYSGLHRLASGQRGYVFLSVGLMLLGFFFVVSVLGTFALMGSPPDRIPLFGRNGAFAPAMAMKMPANVVQPDLAPVPAPVAIDVLPNEPDDFPEDPDAEKSPKVGPDGPLPAGKGKGPLVPPQPIPGVPGPVAGDAVPDRNFIPVEGPAPFQDPERPLRQQGKFHEILQKRLGRPVAPPPPADPSVLREYAHQHQAQPSQVRRDWAETLCWQPALVLKDGTAQVQFDLSDAVTRFQVLVVSHTPDGRLGADTFEIASRLPYAVEPKVPVEVSAADQLVIPVAVANNTSEKVTATLKAQLKGLRPTTDKLPEALALDAGQGKRYLLRLQPSVPEGKAVVRVQARFPRGADAVERSFTIVPDGFPGGGAVSGTVQAGVPVAHEIILPDSYIPGTVKLQLQAYPSPLADLQQGLDALLHEPTGCFEQASSSNYPNVLILNYLQNTKQANPALEKRSRALLEGGYHKLVKFECEDPDHPGTEQGFEWFGGKVPPHEALTAYGLLEFHDMARVFPVDPALLKRTQQYLLDRRDKKGGFLRTPKALDRFGRAPQDVTDAYIVWALTETGVQDEIAPELDALYEKARASKDPYLVALAGLSQLNVGRNERGVELLRRLQGFQKESGEVAGAKTSITSSGGRDLLIETTALATLGWLRAVGPAEFRPNVQKAGKWLLQQRGGAGGFGATQSTVLALKALIAAARENPKGVQAGDLRLEVRQENVPAMTREAKYTPGMTDPLTIKLKDRPGDGPNPPTVLLGTGKNEVEVQLTGNGQLPYTLSWSYRMTKPPSDPACAVQLTTALDRIKAKEGESVKLRAALENKSGQDHGMAVAVIGLPAGLAVPEDFRQLKELTQPRDDGTRPGVIDHWELKGRELVLYWRELRADAKVEFDLDLVCRLPGVYAGPASRAYLYYDSDHKQWIDPLRVTIAAAE